MDFVLEHWRLTIAVGLRIQRNRGVELSHTVERKDGDSLMLTKAKSIAHRFNILLHVTT